MEEGRGREAYVGRGTEKLMFPRWVPPCPPPPREDRGGSGRRAGASDIGGREEPKVMVKHDDWRSVFFEIRAAKLQGPSRRPETLAWPPNYHYGGSPFGRKASSGTKLRSRGPAWKPPLTSSCISSSIDPQNIFFSLAQRRPGSLSVY